MKDLNIPLNDIAPLVEIPDYSLYYFIAVVLIAVAVSVALFLALLKQMRKRKVNLRRERFSALSTIDFSDPKRAAYAISELGRVFASDNERTAKAYHNLFERLAPYKYAPRVEKIDEETLGYYRLYLEIIDV
ncbi:MAG: hypothetical protein A2552_09990 [Sulfuricurvum sp. RIFOXYD2_FULL_44_160]|uniref:DUF4381 domain-containing protein n=1 Tax=Sulfuricurvum kujiense TaxID=148813 RepID=A0A2D3W9M0_9BACT|nr:MULTISPECIES: hypothetical protein [Sulfuricurvum]OHD92922.1 MAG: hypothetical protein A2552_09990 [Sulfuricurvum sp. RIFOXYD2_FULL_44_160]OHD93120.1 MAG: hypothetical protein A2517_10040 [Sulfuricurvum sp. RIFOXYD12_FULL_44_77]DAB38022.1 MAG TPA: hypothetical protein CFH83_08125 [Sulfuricurvum kujiense]